MSATAQLTKTEGRLFLRDPIFLFFGLAFPSVLLLALGYFFPGFDEPSADLNFRTYTEEFAPMMIALGIATLGLVTLPPTLGTYRQFGILRRLRTTPVHPARLLSAQMTIQFVVAVIATAIAVLVAMLAFDIRFPEKILWFVISFILATTSIFSLGLLVGALARSTNSGAAMGMAIYFPLLFLGGLWIPRAVMPAGLKTVSDLTPLGAAVGALTDSWYGSTPEPLYLAVMAVYSVVLGALAVRLFRWE
jgi:ABC-2 type transport system permease protein